MKTLILAGGKGTRLKELTATIPKPLIPVGGKPVLEYQIELLKEHGLSDITILINHFGDRIQEYFGDGVKWGVNISYYVEQVPLGTAGGIKLLADSLQEDFLVLYGDLLLNMDLTRIIKQHKENAATDALLAGTLVVHPNNHPHDSDLVEIDETSNRIGRFLSKPHSEDLLYRNLVNAAVYVLTPRIFDYIPDGVTSDFGKDIFPAVTSAGQHALYAYNSPEYLKDMGTPNRLEQANADMAAGFFANGTLAVSKPAVFLDRDGVINKEVGNLRRMEDFRLIDGATEAIKIINARGYYAVVVTNQPVIAKGFCDYQTVQEIHKKMETELGRSGAKLDAIYLCPHHPEKGFPGENPEYKITCDCRKPAIGLIERAVRDFNIDLGRSYFVGDTSTDALAAKNAKLRFVGVKTGHECRDDKYAGEINWEDMVIYDNILDVVHNIFEKDKNTA